MDKHIEHMLYMQSLSNQLWGPGQNLAPLPTLLINSPPDGLSLMKSSN